MKVRAQRRAVRAETSNIDRLCQHGDAVWCGMYWEQGLLCQDCPLVWGNTVRVFKCPVRANEKPIRRLNENARSNTTD